MLLEGQGPVDHHPQEFGAGIELEGVTPHRKVRLPSGVPGARGEEGDHALLTEEHLLLLAPFFDLLDSQLDVSASFFFVVVTGPDGEVVSEETIVDKVFDLIRQGVDVKDEQQGEVTAPCGTPWISHLVRLRLPLNIIWNCLLLKKALNHLTHLRGTPESMRVRMRSSFHTLS